ncbi:hypothetical protein SUGI_1524020, partial [Cryptomeria japonica]
DQILTEENALLMKKCGGSQFLDGSSSTTWGCPLARRLSSSGLLKPVFPSILCVEDPLVYIRSSEEGREMARAVKKKHDRGKQMMVGGDARGEASGKNMNVK